MSECLSYSGFDFLSSSIERLNVIVVVVVVVVVAVALLVFVLAAISDAFQPVGFVL